MSLELEQEWVKQKAAKQEAGRQSTPPRKSRKGLVVTLVGVAVAAALVAVVVLAGDEPKPTVSDSGGTVKVEIRAMPTAEIRVDGKKVGSTPMSLQYPKSAKQVTVEATMYRHFVRRGGTKDERFVDTRVITLDRDHLLDFKISTAKLVESAESGKDN